MTKEDLEKLFSKYSINIGLEIVPLNKTFIGMDIIQELIARDKEADSEMIAFTEWIPESGYKRVEYTYPKEIRYRKNPTEQGVFMPELLKLFKNREV